MSRGWFTGPVADPRWSRLTTAVGLAAYVVVAWKSCRAYSAKGWNAGGDLKKTWNMYTDSDESDRRLEWKVHEARVRNSFGNYDT